MTNSSVLLARPARVTAAMAAAAVLLYGCGAPERLPSDLSIESSKEVLTERVIAPITALDEETVASPAFDPPPRRKLIQVRHSPASLQDNYFVSNLAKLLSYDELDGTDDDMATSPAPVMQDMSDAEREQIINQRGLERTQILVQKGLTLEADVLTTLRTLDGLIDAGLSNTISGVNGASLPIFGRALNGDGNTYLELPSDLIFVGGENGTIGSKTAFLQRTFDNPEITFAVREMPLSEALSFLFGSIGLQASLSETVLELDTTVSMSVQASAIAIIDSLLEQNELAIVYDPFIEVAQVYNESELDARLLKIKDSIEAYNDNLKKKKDLAKLQEDRERIIEILGYVQLLLSGDDEGFIIGMESVSRVPAGNDTSTEIAKVTRAAIGVQNEMANFDSITAAQLSGKTGISSLAMVPGLAGRDDLKQILSEDPCILPRQEIYTEKVAVYDAAIVDDQNPEKGMVKMIQSFFTEYRKQQPTNSGDSSEDDSSNGDIRPSYCGNSNPEASPIILPDETGITVIGTRTDNDLVARLVEQYDVPQLQVLIEIFIITVSRDFSRQIDSLIKAAPSVGGNGVAEFGFSNLNSMMTDLATATSANKTSSFNLALNAPNNAPTTNYSDQLGLILNFLEKNNLAKVVSSPTVLVADGGKAKVARTQIAQVERVVGVDNATGQDITSYFPYEAPLSLTIDKVDVNRLNQTVKLDVALTDDRFATPLTQVQVDTPKTSDTINTTFWASPGDVIVLAGIAQNSEATATSGLPGMSGDLAPLSPLLGGSDGFSTNLSETMIFMAPTVIDPSTEKQPHSAFRDRPARSATN